LRTAYFTQEGKKRFYKVSQEEGALHCESLKENLFNLNTCINRYVAHKAQMLGTSEAKSLEYVDSLETVSSGLN